MIKVGIVGGTGYTGVELLRLLLGHPEARVGVVTSRAAAGKAVADYFPGLRGHTDLVFQVPGDADLSACDLVFFATPNGTAMHAVPELLAAGVRVVDLAADFRLRDPDLWETWYGVPHACPELLQEAVYGLPETHRGAIAAARLVANPGCYPTAVQLGFLPLLEQQLVDPGHLIADAKSGVSGAGRRLAEASLLCEASENFSAYKVAGHRHLPEIRQQLEQARDGRVGITFVPHLTPMIRGIHGTLYAPWTGGRRDLQDVYVQRYQAEPFVDVMPPGSHPETRSVRGSNHCRIAVHRAPDEQTVVVLVVIDNLVKGAAGQAIQNMNIMFGYDESAGLHAPALVP